jgi:protein-S-isoprenylcysteine O-methyltransferase Ste14
MSADDFKIVFICFLLIGSVIRVIYTKGRRHDPVKIDRKTKLDLYLLFFVGISAVVPIVYITTSSLDFADYALPVWTGWLGSAVFAGAWYFLWRSHADLGRNWCPFVQIKEGHTLVTSGIYSSIRHPMYAAHLLWGIAQALLLWNWIAGPVLLLFFAPIYFTRVSAEEKLLLEHFGDEYREYMKRTGRIIPKL